MQPDHRSILIVTIVSVPSRNDLAVRLDRKRINAILADPYVDQYLSSTSERYVEAAILVVSSKRKRRSPAYALASTSSNYLAVRLNGDSVGKRASASAVHDETCDHFPVGSKSEVRSAIGIVSSKRKCVRTVTGSRHNDLAVGLDRNGPSLLRIRTEVRFRYPSPVPGWIQRPIGRTCRYHGLRPAVRRVNVNGRYDNHQCQ